MSMEIAEFENYLDRYGADFDDWPAAHRNAGVQLAATDESAAQLLAATRLLTTTLGEMTTPEPSASLAERILAATLDEPAPATPAPPPSLIDRAIDWLTGAVWRPVGLAFVPLVLGFAIGLNVQEDVSDFESEVTMLAFSSDEFFDEALDE